jgi:hypothetical protein
MSFNFGICPFNNTTIDLDKVYTLMTPERQSLVAQGSNTGFKIIDNQVYLNDIMITSDELLLGELSLDNLVIQAEQDNHEQDNYEQDNYIPTQEWKSGTSRSPDIISEKEKIMQYHYELFNRINVGIEVSFTSLARSLTELQMQVSMKVQQIFDQQVNVLKLCSPSPDAIIEFQDNARKIDRSLESLCANADNLAHTKLTLSRIAALVNPESNLAQLITISPPPAHSTSHIIANARSNNINWRTPDRLVYDQRLCEQPRIPYEPFSSNLGLSREPFSSNLGLSREPFSSNLGLSREPFSSELRSSREPFSSNLGSNERLLITQHDRNLLREPSERFLITQHDRNLLKYPLDHLSVIRHDRNRMREPLERLSMTQHDRNMLGEEFYNNSHENKRQPRCTCFVFYLPPSITNDSLKKLFMPYGTVLNAYVAMDKVTGSTRGFAFVDFSTPSEAQAAVAALDKYPLEGKFLSVSIKV